MLAVAAIAAIVGLLSLGIWQLQRLAWKESLIERVEQRVHAEPQAEDGLDEHRPLPPGQARLDVDDRAEILAEALGRAQPNRGRIRPERPANIIVETN